MWWKKKQSHHQASSRKVMIAPKKGSNDIDHLEQISSMGENIISVLNGTGTVSLETIQKNIFILSPKPKSLEDNYTVIIEGQEDCSPFILLYIATVDSNC
jgi:hypothetical protein